MAALGRQRERISGGDRGRGGFRVGIVGWHGIVGGCAVEAEGRSSGEHGCEAPRCATEHLGDVGRSMVWTPSN